MTTVISQSSRSQVSNIVKQLKDADQDKEFYPTTDEIIACVQADLAPEGKRSRKTIIDVGAGDGRVLEALTNGTRFAIEQSDILINQQDASVITIGTDFYEQTLLDKPCDVIFCNPPYSDYEGFAEKIIREGMATDVYLVIPERWKNSDAINNAIRLREAKTKTLGAFNFLEADRAARAKIEVVKITLAESDRYHRDDNPFVDPFKAYFDETFQFSNESMSDESYTKDMDELNEHVKNEVMAGRNYVDVLEERYQADLARIFELYQSLTKVDLKLLAEIGVDTKKVANTLKSRMARLKQTYWQELFTNFDKVTERLTDDTRRTMLNTLQSQVNIDFTAKNAHAIVSWVCRAANQYFDKQLDKMMRDMINFDNPSFMNYKSNERVFKADEWRYNRCEMRQQLSHFKFDYRIVLTSFGGMDFDFLDRAKGIKPRLKLFINDLLAIASTIGFDTSKTPRLQEYNGNELDWRPGQAQVFTYYNHTEEKELPLFRIKAYKNQNAHIQFDQRFILALNVAMGRINGWVKTKEEAAQEMGEDINAVAEHFAGVRKLNATDSLLKLTA